MLNMAEMAVLLAGLVVLAVEAMVLTWRGRWRAQFVLPDPAPHRLEPVDLFAGLAAMLLLPSLFASLLSVFFGTAGDTHAAATQAATSQATSAPSPPLPTSLGGAATAAGQLGTIVVLVLICRARFQGGIAGWGLRFERLPLRLGQAVVAYLALWPICTALLYATVAAIQLFRPDFEPTAHEALRAFRAEGQPDWVRFVIVFGAVVLAPFVEEMFFRGLLLPGLARWGRSQWNAVVITGLAFGLFHWEVAYTMPALAFFGLVLGYCYARTQSLTLVILLHAVFNAKTMLWLILGG
jgi:membrane protease YdiL (CAAX protease family)